LRRRARGERNHVPVHLANGRRTAHERRQHHIGSHPCRWRAGEAPEQLAIGPPMRASCSRSGST
jgi:hypothetical protein